jgi:hypothetical protein
MGILFKRPVERTLRVAQALPARSFLIGLVNAVFVLALAFGLGALGSNLGVPVVGLLALLLVACLAVATTFGLAGMVKAIGASLAPTASELRRTIWGTVALALACLAPYVGWFGLLPYVALRGLGAFILSWFQTSIAADLPVG